MPKQGTVSKEDNESSMGLGTCRLTIRVSLIESSKISINITVQVKVASWLDNRSHLSGAFEIANDGLDSSSMGLLGIIGEPSSTANSIGNVRACIGGEIKKHSNDGSAVPFFLHSPSGSKPTTCGEAGIQLGLQLSMLVAFRIFLMRLR